MKITVKTAFTFKGREHLFMNPVKQNKSTMGNGSPYRFAPTADLQIVEDRLKVTIPNWLDATTPGELKTYLLPVSKDRFNKLLEVNGKCAGFIYKAEKYTMYFFVPKYDKMYHSTRKDVDYFYTLLTQDKVPEMDFAAVA